jgi:hypothetical protein
LTSPSEENPSGYEGQGRIPLRPLVLLLGCGAGGHGHGLERGVTSN